MKKNLKSPTNFSLIFFLCICLAFLIIHINNPISESKNNYCEFEIIEATEKAKAVTDIVFYPYKINKSVGFAVDSYTVGNNTVKSLGHTMTFGYGTISSMSAFEKLYDFLSVESYSEVHDIYGQYMGHRNFDGTDILVFFDLGQSSKMLNVVLADYDTVTVLSEEVYNSPNVLEMPTNILKIEQGFIIYLGGENNKVFYNVNVQNKTLTSHSYTCEYVESYLSVSMTYHDGKLYEIINEMDENNNYLGAYLYVYDIKENIVHQEKIHDAQIDFFCGDDNEMLYGEITSENTIIAITHNYDTGEKTKTILPVPYENSLPHVSTQTSVFYKNSYFHIDTQAVNNSTQNNAFYMYDMRNSILVNSYLYKTDGAVNVLFYQSGTNYQHHEENLTTNI